MHYGKPLVQVRQLRLCGSPQGAGLHQNVQHPLPLLRRQNGQKVKRAEDSVWHILIAAN